MKVKKKELTKETITQKNENKKGANVKVTRTNPSLFTTILAAIMIFALLMAVYVVIISPVEIPTRLSNMRIERYKGEDYHIITGDYTGEYDIKYYTEDLSNTNRIKDVRKVMTYNEYVDFCTNKNIDVKYTDKNKNYIVFSYSEQGINYARLAEVQNLGKVVALYVWDTPSHISYYKVRAYVIIIPTDANVNTIVNVVPMYSEGEFDTITNVLNLPEVNFRPGDMVVKKPVIYLYPTKEIQVELKLVNDKLLTCTYPKYIDKWSVLANPDGDLTYIPNGRNLYSLYYEADSLIDFKMTNEGFIVKGEDTASFLEEKLAILGLNEHEAEEFIIYWLPILEANNYNYIRFATRDEIETNMPLDVNPNPDSIIRVLMTFKGLKSPCRVKEQVLETPKRDGFVLVEWGGVEIK